MTDKKSNIDILFDEFLKKFPEEYHDNVNIIKNYVINYVRKSGMTIKYLKACTPYKGVRTNKQVIICSPQFMDTLGDFLYTLFHEIRHEQQIGKIKMDNPITDYDLEDFEKIYHQYWEMELDADQFAKNMVAQLVVMSHLPIEIAKGNLSLSPYIENYPNSSRFVRQSLEPIISLIKDMKKRGEKFTGLEDIPIIKQHLNNLQDLI